MRLSPQDTERFYRIWFALLHFVNEQLHLVPFFPETPDTSAVSAEDTMQVRDALWADDALSERFIADNPAHLSPADLALVASWQHRLSEMFVIYRSLPQYTIFLSEATPAHAYGVLGLVSTIEETVPLPLPMYAQAVLLPFEHRIIYDSLFNSYNVVLGPGIRRRLQEEYRNIQEREEIITSLLPEDQATSLAQAQSGITTRNRKVLTAFRRELRKSGLSEPTEERHVGVIADFAETTLLAHDPPRGLLELTGADLQSYLHREADPAVLTSCKRFVRFLLNTGRMDYEAGEALQAQLRASRRGE
jgi:hypothetical protein